MKPRRFRFRSTCLFGTPLSYGAPVFAGLAVFLTGLNSDARDILRPNASAAGASPAAVAGGGAALTRAATEAARANSRDILQRSGQTLNAMRAMQAAARAAAQGGPDNLGPNLPAVPNGLRPGGLNPAADAATNPASWSGAGQPVETVSGENVNVTIRQTTQQALLQWQTLNVGKKTTLTFDQSAGGENVGQWIAFNKVNDPTGNPTQILGNIKADGQVYLINRNGVIFGGSSQVNARGLTVSSLPINDNLITQGLLNNRDAQFLFSGLFVPGGADGTPDFTPEPPPVSGRFGDVIVQPGAILKSPAGSGGNGGRITLVGANVTQAGTISTESGQTVLAAGLQVAMAAHDGNDPSLRGLDVWVGSVGDYAGSVNQSGIIETLTGSTSITGRLIQQLGIIESSTSVNLNGRIDIKASYGAVANPNFDSASEQGAGGPMFFNQYTGPVTLGGASVTRILPDYASVKAVPGTELPERSQVNIEGLAVHLGKGSIVHAPNGLVSIRAGTWPYKDADGNRTIFDANGNVEAGLDNYFSGTTQRFLFDVGQIYVDEGATINVAGSVDVFVPLVQSILEVEFRGAELADSPLQRESNLRGVSLTVDIRQSGAFNGKFWVGTPLGDVTGLAGIIERNAAQLTALGGDITLQAGESLVLRNGSTLDVSGGFYSHEGGTANTSSLLLGGRRVPIKSATPDRVYDGVFSGTSTFSNAKWGITQTFTNPLVPGTNQQAYQEGAGGGSLSLIAPSMAIDGTLRGITVEGPRQRSVRTAASSLKITFEADRALPIPGSNAISFIKHSPTPPMIQFAAGVSTLSIPEFSLVNDLPVALPAERLASVILPSELLDEEGFGSLEVNNPDGSIVVPENIFLSAAPNGSVKFAAANISVFGSVSAPGGTLSLTTYNISPTFVSEFPILNPGGAQLPLPVPDRGMFVLGGGGRLSTAGLIADDTPGSPSPIGVAISSTGGGITVRSYNASLSPGGVIDVSGGVYISGRGSKTYGKAGTLSLTTGTDAGFPGVIGGTITLGSTLRGYSGSTGGTLNLQASLIDVGAAQNPGALLLTDDFFSSGGFTKYSLNGVGAASTAPPPPGLFESYIPAISIAANANLRPVAESFIAEKDPAVGGAFTLRPFVNVDGLRSPVSLSFTALGSDDPFTLDKLEVRGDILMNGGASIITEPGASISFRAGTITLLGSVTAPGGKISVAGAGSFPLTTSQRLSVSQALPTVHLGKSTRLSVAGVTVLKPDAFGRRVGSVLDGGSISISGNILAEKGGLLDASGTSGTLDLSPSVLAGGGNRPLFLVCGINIPPCNTRGVVATRLDSDGGTIDLSGSQMLLSDATLRGESGGTSATGGQLLVSSGRYYIEGQARTGADTNLVVAQSGDVVLNPNAHLGIGIGLVDPSGAAYGNLGAFSIDRFSEGSFASLSLGGKYFPNASPIPFGGNVEFKGEIDVWASGSVRLAAGGVISADNTVSIHASYLSIGQEFRQPQHPDDVFLAFQRDPALPSSEYNFAPSYGSGSLDLNANLIDIGTLSLQNIGHTGLTAIGGDIRGNGTVSVAGDLVMTAARIYPTTLAKFDVFAYDHAGATGSVTILNGGQSAAPLSAGGSLSIYSSRIVQSGVLLAPLGTIRLGWDGIDLDKNDADVDGPRNLIAGSTIATPVTREVILAGGSTTSVSAKGLVIPFGVSPDGLTWIDPRGVNVTLSGLPEKAIYISGDSITMAAGATMDIQGGGDLLATRWVPGNGGSMDLLGVASTEWGGAEYEPGDLVTYQGETWSARVRHTGQTPGVNNYWSKVADSFAIIPGYTAKYAPYGAYNTGANSTSLAGNPGNISGSLKVGDTITLEASDGVPAGTYTLLPRGYASLEGAFLVTPKSSSSGVGTQKAADGASFVSGYVANSFNPRNITSPVRVRFEVAPSRVYTDRAAYADYSAIQFIPAAGGSQLLPTDAGYAAFHGNSALQLSGSLFTQSTGRGAAVDISSFSDIRLVGGNGVAPADAKVALQSGVLNSWNAESLLIGGIRSRGTGGTSVDVRTANLTLDNPGVLLSGPEIILTSLGTLTLTEGAALASLGTLTGAADTLLIEGDGTLIRVSSDSAATVSRSSLGGSTSPLMSIGAFANIAGPSVTLDSTYGTFLSPLARIDAENLTLASGQISVAFGDASGSLAGSVVSPHLTLAGVTLDKIQQSKVLTLQSYRSIDFYGTGTIGGSALEKIVLSGSGLRGYEQGLGQVVIRANDVFFENPLNIASIAAPLSGSLRIDAETIHLGNSQNTVSGYQDLLLNASDRIVFNGTGAFSTAGNLTANTPLVTGASGAAYSINSAQAFTLVGSGAAVDTTEDLGASLTIQGLSVAANSSILLPSGQLTLRATGGPVTIGGNLSVAGTSREFNDLIRYSNAGTITLESVTGNVTLGAEATVSVAAASGGGNAGTLNVRASNGMFANDGDLVGTANGGTTGRFLLDVGTFAVSGMGSLEAIRTDLDAAGFFASRNFRLRSGDVSIADLHLSREFIFSADSGSILVTGTIDASGETGGAISLSARNNLTLASGAKLTAAAARFNSAGKGGSILLEAGTQSDGVANFGALLDLQAGSEISLGVDDYVPGAYTLAGSSAFEGKFTGTLHLRAPRTATNNDVRVDSIESSIFGASSVLVEGFRVYTPAGGVLNIAQRNLINTDAISFLGSSGVGNANEAAMRGKLLTGAVNSAALDSLLVIAPGVEMLNLTGDLTLGLANNTSSGSTNAEALASADWDLSGFRYGSRSAPGVLTLRAGGDLIFNNTLSDGFTPIAQGSTQTFADNGHSQMWLGTLMTIRDTLPVNTQSWSYRLTAGADVNASNFRNVQSASALDMTQPLKGSVIVGEFYPAVPNNTSTGGNAGVGILGQTADTIRISPSTVNTGNRFEVVRTGTGDIAISAGRDVQLRNQFSTIYTAGVALPVRTTVYEANDFVVPVLPATASSHPSQDGVFAGTLGAIQQLTAASWSMAGGNIAIQAQQNIGRYTSINGVLTVDSSRQMPTNWLYRRGYVDTTGLFASNGGVDPSAGGTSATRVTDTATSTTWWIDYTNFFQGVGTLGGGNVSLVAGHDIVNVDAVAPTNARMPGRMRNPDFNVVPGASEYLNLAPDAERLLEFGGGDVTVRAERNIDGGIYYAEKGEGTLFAGGNITTNAARSPSLGILNNSAPLDPLTWLPTTLFVGKSRFDVAARGDILLGPVTNPFFLPQGLNNKFWYKSHFNTFAPDAGVNLASYGGSVTLRSEATLPDSASSRSILDIWYSNQNLYAGTRSQFNASNFQPWLRLNELGLSTFSGVFSLVAPNLLSTAFGGDINLVGDLTLAPSPLGNLELAASGSITGLQTTGPGRVNGRFPVQVWTSSVINVSDASPASIRDVETPLAYQSSVGRNRLAAVQGFVDILQNVTLALSETGSFSGVAGTSAVKQALHGTSLLHANNPNPVRLYALGGDISGLTLFAPKASQIVAERDITDIALYLQNVSPTDISRVSAGRNVVPFNENAEIRSLAGNIDLGNFVGDVAKATTAGNSTNAVAGDIQISGPGVLEVTSGKNIDLGTGANFNDGTGSGITSIGNNRNLNLPFAGADLIVLAGVSNAAGTGPAGGLSSSSLDIAAFIGKYINPNSVVDSPYLDKLGINDKFSSLTLEQQAIVVLEQFYNILRDTGRTFPETGSYDAGYAAVSTLFGDGKPAGEILTQAREIRTVTGGSITLGAPGGGITMANSIFGNPLTPPGIVTEYGGSISSFTDKDVSIGQARIFTLRGGDITMWSSNGDIAAGTAPRTVVTAPPTRVVIDPTSANIQTDLGGLATGGGIGVLAAIEGVAAGNVDLIAPRGSVDAGDAGIRVTGNLNIAAQTVLNSGNISAGGTTTGTSPASVSAPSISAVTSASNSSAATSSTVASAEKQQPAAEVKAAEEPLSIITVEVIGFGGGGASQEDDEEEKLQP